MEKEYPNPYISFEMIPNQTNPNIVIHIPSNIDKDSIINFSALCSLINNGIFSGLIRNEISVATAKNPKVKLGLDFYDKIYETKTKNYKSNKLVVPPTKVFSLIDKDDEE